jgi:putative ABC transport system permease protein
MDLSAMWSVIRRHHRSALLIVVQTALTLALVANALWISVQRIERMSKPSGVPESELISVRNLWTGADANWRVRVEADLAAIRGFPGVIAAYATDSFPLLGGGSIVDIGVQPDQKDPTTVAAPYSVDEHALRTLGLNLVAGEWFGPLDIQRSRDLAGSDAVIVTEDVARTAFPDAIAVGKTIYVSGMPHRIKGVIAPIAIHVPEEDWNRAFSSKVVLIPRLLADSEAFYMVRTTMGTRDTTLRNLQVHLLQMDRNRVLDRDKTFSDIRREAFAGDRALVFVLGVVATLLLVVTALGILGTSSLWVSARRRDIGILRAMGARRRDVMRYFHCENLLLVTCGVAIGVLLGVAGNAWTVRTFATGLIEDWFWLGGSLAVIALGQLGVLAPALRAAAVPPVEAIRAVDFGSGR